MITSYQRTPTGLAPSPGLVKTKPAPLWVDLSYLTRSEELAVESAFRIEVPTREEMADFEVSNRLYAYGEALYLTITLPYQLETDFPTITDLSFILTPSTLITLRYADPKAFSLYLQATERTLPTTADHVLSGLFEALAERLSEALTRVNRDTNDIAANIFAPAQGRRHAPLQGLVEQLGRDGDLLGKLRESFLSIQRAVGFLMQNQTVNLSPNAQGVLKTLGTDLQSLLDHTNFLTSKISFLLDATLGLMSIEQNNIIKIFSVAAVIFLPPTLVASLYGMNFAYMPELQWEYGYLWAVGLMVLAAAVPYLYFKRRGWL